MSSIVPATKTTTNIIVRFSLDIIFLVLNTSATFRIITFDIDDNQIEITNIELAGDDYTNWGNDDKYVLQFVATKLGFTLLP